MIDFACEVAMGNLNWSQVIGGVVIGSILGVGATLYLQNERITRLEERIAAAGRQSSRPAAPAGSSGPRDVPTADPHRLSDFIKTEQRRNVRESYGELAHQCFTDDDLRRFEKAKRPAAIAENLRSDKDYVATLIALKRASPPDRQRVLRDSVKPLRPTWAELGRISREGQTEAGQKAELMIAEAIVESTKALLKKSEAELGSLYRQ